ncbi:MAG: hypothetical protein QOJ03_115 [Frankiaceae bacterium]|jgi:hypothetical protein|nr:hypothetical protein [Frankiaceae bacterium]
MDAYVFGQHDGDLPTHLVGQGIEGNRIRAMAALQGDDHNIFYALEVESLEDLDRHIGQLTEAGSAAVITLVPDFDAIASGPIHVPPLPPPPTPAWIPPYPWLVFVITSVEDVVGLVVKLREQLGDDAVAVWQAADGRYLIEAGAAERSALESAFDEISGTGGMTDDTRLFAAGDELHRA